MTQAAQDLLLWLVPATFIGALGYVLSGRVRSSTKVQGVGHVIYCTVAASTAGLGILATGQNELVAFLAGLGASLTGPVIAEVYRIRLTQAKQRRDK